MQKLAVAFMASMLLPVSAQAATIFGVDENNNLVTFDSLNPAVFTSSTPITGTTATWLAIDFRDSDGMLYGLGDDYGLYTVNTNTGMANLVAGSLPLTGTNFGFDFNTVVDAIRVVGNFDDNYVVNADTGAVSQFTDVAYGPGDPNFGSNAVVTGNGYIHGTTTQYAIETNADVLVTQANNAGTLGTVGSLGAAVGPRTSFDIGFNGVAYMQDVDRFYTVDLGTGAATLVGNTPTALFGISSAAPSAIPEPATWAMLLMGFGFIGATIRPQGQGAHERRLRLIDSTFRVPPRARHCGAPFFAARSGRR